MSIRRDIGLFIPNGYTFFDLIVEQDDFLTDLGLETAIAISLFSDQRITLQEIPDGEVTRKGWWGDMFPTAEGDKIGSKLWIYRRRKRTNETRLAIIQAAKDSLAWLIEDGVAKSVVVNGEFFGENALGQIGLTIDIERSNGPAAKYSVIWDSQGVRRA